MQGILNWKKCKQCDGAFDIDTSKDLCPKCRNKFEVEGDVKSNP